MMTKLDVTTEYLEQVNALRKQGPGVADGSPAADAAVDRVRRLLADFKAPDFVARIPAVYAASVYFNDTLKTVRTADALQAYLGETAENLKLGTVTFHDHTFHDGDHYLRWSMTLRLKRFARGRSLTSIGMTHLRFDEAGLVVLHQDYWDAAGGFFEHVPVLGWMVRTIKRRL